MSRLNPRFLKLDSATLEYNPTTEDLRQVAGTDGGGEKYLGGQLLVIDPINPTSANDDDLTTPFLTIAGAVSAAQTANLDFITLELYPGDYSGDVSLTGIRGITLTSPCELPLAEGQSLVVTGQYARILGQVTVSQVEHFTLKNTMIYNTASGKSALVLQGHTTTNCTVVVRNSSVVTTATGEHSLEINIAALSDPRQVNLSIDSSNIGGVLGLKYNDKASLPYNRFAFSAKNSILTRMDFTGTTVTGNAYYFFRDCIFVGRLDITGSTFYLDNCTHGRPDAPLSGAIYNVGNASVYATNCDFSCSTSITATASGTLTLYLTACNSTGSTNSFSAGTTVVYLNTETKGQFGILGVGGWGSLTAGAQIQDQIETATHKVNYRYVEYDDSGNDYLEFTGFLPYDYDGGTLKATFYWVAPSVTGGVVWAVQGRAFSDTESLDQAWGTAATTVGSVGGSVAHLLKVTPTSAGALTLAGGPSANDLVQFRVYRNTSSGSDTCTAAVRLIGVMFEYSSTRRFSS